MASLDKPFEGTQVSRVTSIDGMTRPQVKQELDKYLRRGWILVAIYNEANQTRAVFTRTKE